jgi:hypothetical protein
MTPMRAIIVGPLRDISSVSFFEYGARLQNEPPNDRFLLWLLIVQLKLESEVHTHHSVLDFNRRELSRNMKMERESRNATQLDRLAGRSVSYEVDRIFVFVKSLKSALYWLVQADCCTA